MLSFGMVACSGIAVVAHHRRTPSAGAALVALVAIGAGLIFPRFEQPGKTVLHYSAEANRHSQQRFPGWVTALACCMSYAGPILAAIVVARGLLHHQVGNRRAHRDIRTQSRVTGGCSSPSPANG